MFTWRLIKTGESDPYFNMALDEVLFQQFQRSKIPIFRIYGWSKPSLTLGFFQDPLEVLNIEQCRDRGIAFIRRITGGGVILHENEITYSIICSRSGLRLSNIKESVRILCSFIMTFYRRLGLHPFFSIDKYGSSSKKISSFCFASRGDSDILIDNKKIGGCAQRRRKDIVFHHGLVPLSLDFNLVRTLIKEDVKETSANVVFLNDLVGKKINFEEAIACMERSFEDALSCKLEEDKLTAEELRAVSVLEREKYGEFKRNLYKNPFFRNQFCT